MKYVLTIIGGVLLAFGAATYGLKATLDPLQRDAQPEAVATRLDHINDELKQALGIADESEKDRALKQCVLLLENEASTLRQAQR